MQDPTGSTDLVDAILSKAVAGGILHLDARDSAFDGRWITLRSGRAIHFGSSSYLGLELDPRLVAAAVDAARRFGTQFSSSRAYVSAPLYEELESLLDRIFAGHTLVTTSTTMGHLATLPIAIGPRDAAILDHQVHQSVHMAVPHLRSQGTAVELVRHGRLDLLDARVRELSSRHARVWYLADGVYSMYGELAPIRALAWLLARHEQLHLYIDDAHGMSWCGRRGRGYAADALDGEERVVIAVSLNKAFGAAGGAVVFRDPELRRRVRTCGGPLIFGGPLQPPLLGAAVASARIHLSPEIASMQAELLELVRFTNRTARELDLPLASADEVPIRYVGAGVEAAATDAVRHLISRGVYANPAAFPAVGSRQAGIRLMLTRHHTRDDVRHALETLAERLPTSLAHAGIGRDEVERSFGLAAPRPERRGGAAARLRVEHRRSIHELDAAEWDACLGARGSFDAATLAALERVFGAHQPPESRWRFHYLLVRDAGGRLLLATFFTEALWKDDLLAAAAVSQQCERRRAADPLFLTSRCLAMGSLLTEGDHLFLDRGGDWRGALAQMLAAVNAQRDACGAASLVLRDLPAADGEMAAALAEAGFFAVPLPDSLAVEIDWAERDEFLAARSRRERRFLRREVLAWESAWDVEVLGPGGREPAADEWEQLHRLYRNVHGRQLALNTFPLPREILPQLGRCPGWELLLLRLRPEHGGDPQGPPGGFAACHAGRGGYAPVFVGMDYELVESKGLYRQLLHRTLERARALGAPRVRFGMGSELEKARFGARPEQRVMYVQSHDRFHHDVLSLIAAEAALRRRS